MKIAILSGKGGTGKTLLAVNLAALNKNSRYIDCDVEEPNGHIFFKPENVVKDSVNVLVAEVDQDLCNGCRRCVEFCKFNALAYVKDKLLVFEEICHSCGGCMIVCPEKALSEKERTIGIIERGQSEGVEVFTGILNMGEPSGIPIINKLLEEDKKSPREYTFIDSPPGTACIVMESIKDADYCILMAEPTIFGLHNLNMVYELVKLFNKPFGVVLNKTLDDKNPTEEFCINNGIKILGKIPFDNELGKVNSQGKIAVRENNNFKKIFESIFNMVVKEANHEAASNTKR